MCSSSRLSVKMPFFIYITWMAKLTSFLFLLVSSFLKSMCYCCFSCYIFGVMWFFLLKRKKDLALFKKKKKNLKKSMLLCVDLWTSSADYYYISIWAFILGMSICPRCATCWCGALTPLQNVMALIHHFHPSFFTDKRQWLTVSV